MNTTDAGAPPEGGRPGGFFSREATDMTLLLSTADTSPIGLSCHNQAG